MPAKMNLGTVLSTTSSMLSITVPCFVELKCFHIILHLTMLVRKILLLAYV